MSIGGVSINYKDKVNKILSDMHSVSGTDKGGFGEAAVFVQTEQYYQRRGGILIHSYEYKSHPDMPGNVHIDGRHLSVGKLPGKTEIDILYVSPFHIFPIEVKAYKAKKITLTDGAIDGCYKTDKSPIHQNEMHCRHLYKHIFQVIPEGDIHYKYIIPIVVFVDKCILIDNRSDWQKQYIRVAILNNFIKILEQLDKPEQYKLNLSDIDARLKDAMISNSKYLPVRYV